MEDHAPGFGALGFLVILGFRVEWLLGLGCRGLRVHRFRICGLSVWDLGVQVYVQVHG